MINKCFKSNENMLQYKIDQRLVILILKQIVNLSWMNKNNSNLVRKNGTVKTSPLGTKYCYSNCQRPLIQPRVIRHQRVCKKASSDNKIPTFQQNSYNINNCGKLKNFPIGSKPLIDSRQLKHSVDVRTQSKYLKSKQFNRENQASSKLEINQLNTSQQIPKRHTKSVMVVGSDIFENNSKNKKSNQTNNCSNKDSNAATRRKPSLKTVNAQKNRKAKSRLDSQIKLKTQDFRVIANCLRQYSKDERTKGEKPDCENILKFIRAFNRSEIATISKPLQSLISQILVSIQQNILIDQRSMGQPVQGFSDKIYPKNKRNRTKTSCNDSQFDDLTIKKQIQGKNTIQNGYTNKKQNNYSQHYDQKALDFGKNRTCSGTRLGQSQIRNNMHSIQKKVQQEGILFNLKKRSIDLQNLQNQQVRLQKFKQELQKNPMTKQQKSYQIKRLSQLLVFQKQAMMAVYPSNLGQPKPVRRTMTYDSDSEGQQFFNYQIHD